MIAYAAEGRHMYAHLPISHVGIFVYPFLMEQKNAVGYGVVIGVLMAGLAGGLIAGYFYSFARYQAGHDAGYAKGAQDVRLASEAKAIEEARRAAEAVNPFGSGGVNPLGDGYKNPYEDANINPFK